MTLAEYIDKLNQTLKANPEYADHKVITRRYASFEFDSVAGDLRTGQYSTRFAYFASRKDLWAMDDPTLVDAILIE